MFNSENINDIAKRILLPILVVLLTSCSGSSPATATPAAERIETTTYIAPTRVQTSIPSEISEGIRQICPSFVPVSNKLNNLNGELLFDHIKAIQFPNTTQISLLHDENKEYFDVTVSSDGKFLATDTNLYDAAGNSLQETLDIYSSNGDIVASEPWNKQTWSVISGWAGNEVVIQSTRKNSLVAVNPLLKTSRDIALDQTVGQDISIIAYDPSLKFIAYYYPNDPATKVRMVIWDATNKKTVWTTENLYYPMISSVVWSHNGSKAAIATLPLDEINYHSEIVVVDKNGNLVQISNFRKAFEQIQIVDMKWSLDDKKLFFWAWTHDKNVTAESNYDLYEINVNTGLVSRYCITGDAQNNPIVWLADYPQYFVINNFTTYDSYNGIYKWDVLLVDGQSNKAYKLGEDFVPLGWMKSP